MRIGKEIALELRKCKIEICDEYYQNMITFTNYAQLAAMYFRGSDWSMENDFPRIDILKKHQGGLLPYGMITDGSGTYSNQKYLAVFGDSDLSLKYDAFSVGNIIIRHNSKATIEASGNAFLIINIIDNAEVEINCTDDAKISVFDYGQNTKIKTSGNVKIVPSKWQK